MLVAIGNVYRLNNAIFYMPAMFMLKSIRVYSTKRVPSFPLQKGSDTVNYFNRLIANRLKCRIPVNQLTTLHIWLAPSQLHYISKSWLTGLKYFNPFIS